MKIPKSMNCAFLFVLGAFVSLALDILGIMPLSTVSVLGSNIHVSNLEYFVLPAVYIIGGIIIGAVSKNNGSACIYAACFGQCQTILPLIIYYFILHEGTPLDIWLRAISGMFLSVPFAGIAFSIKTLIKNSVKNRS